jgi:hypothetical protein
MWMGVLSWMMTGTLGVVHRAVAEKSLAVPKLPAGCPQAPVPLHCDSESRTGTYVMFTAPAPNPGHSRPLAGVTTDHDDAMIHCSYH